MLKITSGNDEVGKRNIANVLAFYELMINQKNPTEATKKYLVSDYIQHNPLIPTGAQALGEFFENAVKGRPKLRVSVHKIVAAGDYVWAHVNFLNLYSDADDDRGIAGVDIYRLNSEGKVAEHWDVLQEVPAPQISANQNGMF